MFSYRRTGTPRPRAMTTFGAISTGDALPTLEVKIRARHVVMGASSSRDWQPQHHDTHWAVERVKVKDIFLNTPNQAGWIERYLTDWTGPKGRLGKLRFKMKKSVCAGDKLTFDGTVTGTSTDEQGIGWVDVDLRSIRRRRARDGMPSAGRPSPFPTTTTRGSAAVTNGDPNGAEAVRRAGDAARRRPIAVRTAFSDRDRPIARRRREGIQRRSVDRAAAHGPARTSRPGGERWRGLAPDRSVGRLRRARARAGSRSLRRHGRVRSGAAGARRRCRRRWRGTRPSVPTAKRVWRFASTARRSLGRRSSYHSPPLRPR